MRGRLARLLVPLALVAAALATFGCAAKRMQVGSDRFEKAQLAESGAIAAEIEKLTARATKLMEVCSADKFTSGLTYKRLAPFFETQKDRDAFVATFAARLREAGFRRDRIKSFEIERVAIEKNEVVGFVRVRLKGHFWGPFSTELVEVMVWKKVKDEWFVWPQLQQR